MSDLRGRQNRVCLSKILARSNLKYFIPQALYLGKGNDPSYLLQFGR
jgi:hypothetical protein